MSVAVSVRRSRLPGSPPRHAERLPISHHRRHQRLRHTRRPPPVCPVPVRLKFDWSVLFGIRGGSEEEKANAVDDWSHVTMEGCRAVVVRLGVKRAVWPSGRSVTIASA